MMSMDLHKYLDNGQPLRMMAEVLESDPSDEDGGHVPKPKIFPEAKRAWCFELLPPTTKVVDT